MNIKKKKKKKKTLCPDGTRGRMKKIEEKKKIREKVIRWRTPLSLYALPGYSW